jgi:hypothetical protein
MKYTAHANKRSRQRALPSEVIDLLMSFGDEYRSTRGTRIKALASKFARNEFSQELKFRGIRIKENWSDAYLVIGSCGTIITAGYRYRKLQNHIH